METMTGSPLANPVLLCIYIYILTSGVWVMAKGDVRAATDSQRVAEAAGVPRLVGSVWAEAERRP